jgi:serine/threonine protein kinase
MEQNIDYSELHFMEVIGQGSYGTVYKASYNGSIVARKFT